MLAHMQASDGGNIVRSGEVFRGARMKPLLLVTEDELRCRVAKERETQTNTVTDVDAKNAERQRPTQARPASSQGTREETKDIWERVYEKGQEHVSILRRRNTASKVCCRGSFSFLADVACISLRQLPCCRTEEATD